MGRPRKVVVIEELGDATGVTLLERKGGDYRPRRSVRVPLRVQDGLRPILEAAEAPGPPLGRVGLLVLLTDARCAAGAVTTDGEAAEIEGRLDEAIRRAVMPGQGDELIRAESPANGGSHRSWSAAPLSYLEFIAAELAALGAEVAHAAPLEHVLASLDEQPSAVLDLRSEPARLCLTAGGSLLASRRFKMPMIALGEGLAGFDPTDQVARELQRSLQFLQGQAAVTPKRLWLSAAPEALVEARPKLAAELGLEVDVVAPAAVDGLDEPEMARIHAAAASLPAASVPWLIEPPRRSMLTLGGQALRRAGVLLIALGAAGFGYDLHSDGPARRSASFALRDELDTLRVEAELELDRLAVPAWVGTRAAAYQALHEPAHALSRLLANLGAARSDSIGLTSLKLEAAGAIRVEGLCHPLSDDSARLAAFQQLVEALEKSPGITTLHGGLQRAEDLGAETSPDKFVWQGTLQRSEP